MTNAGQDRERTYQVKSGARFSGRVVLTHRNEDGSPNGIVRVEITDPGNTRYRRFERVDVGAIAEIVTRWCTTHGHGPCVGPPC